MLESYENDHHTGMNIQNMARLLFDFTSGYPVLVSWLCKLIDERIPGSTEFPDKTSAWTKQGCLEAVKILPEEKSPLFESLTGKLSDYPELKKIIHLLLFQGQRIAYNPDDPAIDAAIMFGSVAVSNRIFETRLYNMFLTLPEIQSTDPEHGTHGSDH